MSAPAAAPARTSHRSTGRNRPLARTGTLIRFALRRERLRIPLWALGTGLLVGYVGTAVPLAYPNPAAMQARAEIMKDPAGALLAGPGYGLDDYALGPMLANEVLGMAAVAAALMSVFLVVRHTRAEEETGRAELILAGRVGRLAPLTAALVTLLAANAAVFVALAAAVVGNDLPVADALALAAGAALVGMAFGCLAAVTAQLAEQARTASGMAGGLVGVAFLVRGIGDSQRLGGSALSWFSPIGWAQQTRAFVDLRWWPLLLCAGLAALLTAVAYVLVARRDLGAGLVPSRRGRPDGTRLFLRPAGLVLRLERGSIISWCAGLFVFAVLTGSMGETIVASFEAQPQLAAVLGVSAADDVVRAALAAFLKYFAMAVAVFTLISVSRMRKEESEGRTGQVLATRVSRVRWLAASLLVSGLSATAMLVLSGLGLGLGFLSATQDASMVGEFAVAGLAFLPLVLCVAGAAILAYGRATGTWWVWVLLVASMLVGLYGPLLNLPGALLDAEPFGLVPAVPGEELSPAPLAWMSGVALALLALGAAAFRKRDLAA